MKVLQALRQDPKQWHGFWFGPPVTSQRELAALHRLRQCEVLAPTLHDFRSTILHFHVVPCMLLTGDPIFALLQSSKQQWHHFLVLGMP